MASKDLSDFFNIPRIDQAVEGSWRGVGWGAGVAAAWHAQGSKRHC